MSHKSLAGGAVIQKREVGTRHKKIPPATQDSCHAKKRVPKRFLGRQNFPYLKHGTRDFKAKSGRDSGLTVYAGRSGGWVAKNPRDYGIEEPFWGPFKNDSLLQSLGLHYRSLVVIRFGKLHLNSHFIWPLSNTPAV